MTLKCDEFSSSDRDRVGNQALLELSLKTGLTLVFALLQQNWQMQQVNPGCNLLCNRVLTSALDVLTKLPPLSLSNLSKIPGDVGQMTLNEVTDFLGHAMNPANIGNDFEGSRLASEVLLLLAIQRGQLSLILQWILSALKVYETNTSTDQDLKISSDTIRLAIHQIRSVTGIRRMSGSDDLHDLDGGMMKLEAAAKTILTEVVEHSTDHSSHQSNEIVSGGISRNEAFIWGSNSSHQLAEGNQEKILSPKRTSAFQDVLLMEAGQYCTFVVHLNGNVTGCGKGTYGRLGLGDSTNQAIPRKLTTISTPVKTVSSSKGSDGHTLALTEDGRVFSWGDGDYGKNFFLLIRK